MIHMQTSKRKLRRQNQTKFYTSDNEYEFILRLAGTMLTMQDVISSRIFSKGWEKELQNLRKKQREEGIADTWFFSPQKRSELKLNPRRSRLKAELAA